jgi:hypothetical protein
MTSSTRPSSSSAWALACLCFTFAGPALANGAFPKVSQLAVDPGDPNHLVLRSNFGLVVSSDGGKSWDWLCEAGLGYSNTEPPIAIVSGGVVLVGVTGGIRVGDAHGCDFVVTQDLGGDIDDLSAELPVPGGALALTTDVAKNSSQVWETLDSGKTWQKLGAPLDGFIGLTLDMARSDPNRIYVSGLSDVGTPAGAFAMSDDHGETWTLSGVPDSDANAQPYIAAIQPNDEDTVYVRLTGPGVLEVTHDAGKTFTRALAFDGELDGFAVSPDGASVLVSSPYVGMFRAKADDLAFEQFACSGVSSLSWTAAGLIGSGSDSWNGFLLGQSNDDGQSFEVLLSQFCIRGPLACDASTSTGAVCPDQWAAMAIQLGQNMLKCDPEAKAQPLKTCDSSAGSAGVSAGGTAGLGAGGTSAPSSAGSGGISSNAGKSSTAGSGGSSPGAGGQLGNGGGQSTSPEMRAGSAGKTAARSSNSSSGCACSLLGTQPLEWYAWLALAGATGAIARRRGRTANGRPS